MSQKNVFTDVPAFNESRLMGTHQLIKHFPKPIRPNLWDFFYKHVAQWDRSELLKDLRVIHLRDQLNKKWSWPVLAAFHFFRSSILAHIIFDDSPLKKWALNPSGPGALSGWKLSTTFSISSVVTCRINPSYWSSVRTLSNWKLLFTLQDLSQDVLKMRNSSRRNSILYREKGGVSSFSDVDGHSYRDYFTSDLEVEESICYLTFRMALRKILSSWSRTKRYEIRGLNEPSASETGALTCISYGSFSGERSLVLIPSQIWSDGGTPIR